MTTRTSIAAALLALTVLVVLGLQSRIRGTEEDTRLLTDAQRLRELDTQLDEAVLEAHAGLSQSYDPLAATLQEMSVVEGEIYELVGAAGDPSLTGAALRAREATRAQADLVSRFEWRNALLRNSLAYLPRAASNAVELRGTGEDDVIARQVTSLMAAVLQCRNHCDAAAVADMEGQL